MSLVYGDSRIPFGGINDDGDDFDSKPGSLDPSSYNVIPNRSVSSLVSRGGFVSPMDFPTVGNGLKTGMSIEKILHVDKFRVTKPSETTVTVMIALCKWTLNSGVVYMLRIFMNPSFSSGVFGASTTWQEKEVWYIDEVKSTTNLTRVAEAGARNGERWTLQFAVAPSNGGYFAPDFFNGYLYLEDDANFTSPAVHLAEGDKVYDDPWTVYSGSSYTASFVVESAHAAGVWDAANMNFIRFHKNLETGKIPYNDLCSTSSTFFDQYSFETEMVDEKIILSVHAGESGRASFTLSLNYVKRTFFGSGRIYSKADYIYNGGGGADTLYDKHLVYGFPNYENINKSNVATVFDGKALKRWLTTRTDMTDPSRVVGADDTVAASGYDKVMGKITAGTAFNTTGAPITDNMYVIEACDTSIVVDDFVMAEWDVHGRMGGHKNFDAHGYKTSGEIRDSSSYKYLNFPEYTDPYFFDGDEINGSEVGWPNGIISKITITNPTANKVYADSARMDITGFDATNGSKAIVSLAQALYEQEDKERELKSLKKKAKKLSSIILLKPDDFETRFELKKIVKQIQVAESRIQDGMIKSVTVIYGGNLYNDAAVGTILPAPTGVAVPATFTIDVDYSFFYTYLVAIYDGYRYGLHYNGGLRLGSTTTSARVLNNVLLYSFFVPSNFNRFITGVSCGMSKNFDSSTRVKHTLLEYLDAHVVFTDDLSSGFDFRLTYDGGSMEGNYGYTYTKVTRIDKQKFDNSDYGSNHMHLTGNPSFSRNNLNYTVDNPNAFAVLYSLGLGVSQSSFMKKDVSFGNKSIAFLRDMMFACDSQCQEYQLGVIQDTIQKLKHEVCFTPTNTQFGGNFHQFNDAVYQFTTREAGKAVAVVGVSMGGGETFNEKRNNLLVLCDRGYIYVDMRNENFEPYYNSGVGCVSRKSVAKYNGQAFWAGENDVYMWDESQAIPITRMGGSSINKTWRAIPIANKRLSVGVYNEDRKQYWLFVNNGSANVAYVFDFVLNNIYSFLIPSGVPTSAGFMDGKVWAVFSLALDQWEYIESATTDTHTTGSVFAPGATNYGLNLVFNNVKGSERMSVLKSVAITYTGSPSLVPTVDGQVGAGMSPPASVTKQYLERKVKYSGFGSKNNRGRRYSVTIQQTSGYFELFDLTLGIDTKVPQKTLIGGII